MNIKILLAKHTFCRFDLFFSVNSEKKNHIKTDFFLSANEASALDGVCTSEHVHMHRIRFLQPLSIFLWDVALVHFNVLSLGSTSRTCYWTWMHNNWARLKEQKKNQRRRRRWNKIKKAKTYTPHRARSIVNKYNVVQVLSMDNFFFRV